LIYRPVKFVAVWDGHFGAMKNVEGRGKSLSKCEEQFTALTFLRDMQCSNNAS